MYVLQWIIQYNRIDMFDIYLQRKEDLIGEFSLEDVDNEYVFKKLVEHPYTNIIGEDGLDTLTYTNNKLYAKYIIKYLSELIKSEDTNTTVEEIYYYITNKYYQRYLLEFFTPEELHGLDIYLPTTVEEYVEENKEGYERNGIEVVNKIIHENIEYLSYLKDIKPYDIDDILELLGKSYLKDSLKSSLSDVLDSIVHGDGMKLITKLIREY